MLLYVHILFHLLTQNTNLALLTMTQNLSGFSFAITSLFNDLPITLSVYTLPNFIDHIYSSNMNVV